MDISSFISGLKIIQAAKPITESDYHGRAEHDMFYAGDLEWKMSAKDIKKLEDLGWVADGDANGWHAMF
jgi:hypothetical protein